MVAKLEKGRPDFHETQFYIDDNYVGRPPEVQVGITNVNDNINEKFLHNSLSKLGSIRKLEIVKHPKTGAHLKMAKVQFDKASVAKACIDSYNKKSLMGCSLSVFLDIRFEKIEQLKEEAINQVANPRQILPIHGLTNETNVNHPHFSTQQPILPLHSSQQPILPIHHPHLQNSTNPIPSPHSLEYPITTPSSLNSTIGTPEPSSRQRLEDRIAILMKQPNSILSTIVAPTAPQITPVYSAFDTNYYHPHIGAPSKALDKQHPELNNIQFTSNHNNYRNHKEPYQNHDRINNKHSNYDHHRDDHNSDDGWNILPEIKKQPLEIKLTEKQIEEEVLPYCYKVFHDELSRNLQITIFKKLRENHGYQCLEKAQIAFKERQDKLKVQRDKERIERELARQFERRFMSKARIEKPTEAPRQRFNLLRQRTTTSSNMEGVRRQQEVTEQTPRRKNRSSAMAEPERRGSHNTSIGSSSDSRSSSSSRSSYSRSSSSSSSSSRASSRSSSPSSSSSYSSDSSASVSSFSGSSSDSSQSVRAKNNALEIEGRVRTPEFGSDSKTKNDREQIAAVALLEMRSEIAKNEPAPRYLDDAESERDVDEPIKKSTKTAGRKRKKKVNEVVGMASEYRAAKKFASGTLGSYDEDIENAVVEDENFLDEKPELKYMYPARSDAEKQRLLDDLYGTLSEEDLKYLEEVHQKYNAKEANKRDDVMIPFGSESANRAHLGMRKHMIEGKAAEGHPKWWRGCSRCDVIEVNDKERLKEEMNYEDLIRAEIKSDRKTDGLQPTFTSSRRDQRGDQRRMLLFNNDIDRCIMKQYTTSALKVSFLTITLINLLINRSVFQ